MCTLTYQNLLFCRVRIDSILGFIVRTYKKVGFGSLRYIPKPSTPTQTRANSAWAAEFCGRPSQEIGAVPKLGMSFGFVEWKL